MIQAIKDEKDKIASHGVVEALSKPIFSTRHTILMNNEPISVWIRGNQVLKAKFMEKNVDLSGLDATAIAAIKDSPTRVVNGNNLQSNDNFTKHVSKMIDSQLSLAIAKNDKRILSRFSRSELVPDAQKENFIEAINRPNGLRGLLTRAINKTNNIFQNLAKKIDKFFDKQRDKIANKKLDKYLDAYQLKEFNKSPPATDLNLSQNIDPKLADLAADFVKAKGISDLSDTHTADKMLQDEFMKQAVRNGHKIDDAKVALFKTVHQNKEVQQAQDNIVNISNQEKQILELQATIDSLQNQLKAEQLKTASKNETLEDFVTLSKDLSQTDRIDILVENKEYQGLSEDAKLQVEDQLIFNPKLEKRQQQNIEELQDKSKELETISKELEKPQEVKISFDKKSVNEAWKVAQIENRKQEIPSQKFMNLSALKFGGVSEQSLNKWGAQMDSLRDKGKNVPTQEKVQEFIQGSLNNAARLAQQSILTQTATNEYKFTNDASKDTLFSSVMQKEQVVDLKERVKDLSSEKSFEKMLKKDGSLDVNMLQQYATKLQEVATAIEVQNKANSVSVTKEDLKDLNRSQSQSQSNDQQRAM